MLGSISLLEWLGYLSSVIVAISLTMSSIIKLRWLNLIGAALFSFYGFAIGSMPVGFLNFFIVCINIYYLIKIYTQKEAFKLLQSEKTDAYLDYFINFNIAEINRFFPGFKSEYLTQENNNLLIFKLLRDTILAGLFVGAKQENTLTIMLDYVSAPYRDLKPGKFIFQQNADLFKANGINKLIVHTSNQQHIKYLEKMNFSKSDNNVYFLDI